MKIKTEITCSKCPNIITCKNKTGLCRSCRCTGEGNQFYGKSHRVDTILKIKNSKIGTSAWNKGLSLPKGAISGGFCTKKICEFCKSKVTHANYKRHVASCTGSPLKVYLSTNQCKNCKNIFHKPQEFCSMSCYREYKRKQVKPYLHNCVVCQKEYSSKHNKQSRKTCSQKCLSELISKNSRENVNCGAKAGYKTTKSKRVFYKDILLDSNWELQLALWFDLKNIKWKRSRGMYFHWIDDFGKQRRYTPDFFLVDLNVYVDCKNRYLMKIDSQKIQRVRKTHNLKLMTGGVNYIKSTITKVT